MKTKDSLLRFTSRAVAVAVGTTGRHVKQQTKRRTRLKQNKDAVCLET